MARIIENGMRMRSAGYTSRDKAEEVLLALRQVAKAVGGEIRAYGVKILRTNPGTDFVGECDWKKIWGEFSIWLQVGDPYWKSPQVIRQEEYLDW